MLSRRLVMNGGAVLHYALINLFRTLAPPAGFHITKIGEKAGVIVNDDGKAARAHDLRRSFGQRMADAGLPPRDLQAILRHSSFTTTEKYYLKSNAAEQAERIARYLSGRIPEGIHQPAEASPCRAGRSCFRISAL